MGERVSARIHFLCFCTYKITELLCVDVPLQGKGYAKMVGRNCSSEHDKEANGACGASWGPLVG